MIRERKQLGVPVRVRCAPLGGPSPRQIDLGLAETNLIVFLSERELITDFQKDWAPFYQPLKQKILEQGSGVSGLVIAVTRGGTQLPGLDGLEAERLFDYRHGYETTLANGEPNEWMRRLLLVLLNVAGGLVRHMIARLSGDPREVHIADQPIKIFLSHSHRGGRRVAEAISKHLKEINAQRGGLVPFLDSEALPIGQNYQTKFEEAIKDGIFLAVHSDDYATRRFCRWEMVCAKRHRRPILVAQTLSKGESRSFPYSGNTPLAVLEGYSQESANSESSGRWPWTRIGSRAGSETPANRSAVALSEQKMQRLVGNLLLAVMSETLRFLIFVSDASRAAREAQQRPAAILPRPPELADLAELHRQFRSAPARTGETVILYPDPPLDDVEIELVDTLSPPFVAMTLSEFRSGGRHLGEQSQLRNKILAEPEPRLVGVAVANISDLELAALGYQKLSDSRSVLWQALAEIVTVVAQLGGRLGYGGDLRPGGITRSLFEEVADAYHVLELNGYDRFVNYLACSVWRGVDSGRFHLPPAALADHIHSMALLGEVQIYLPDGSYAALQAVEPNLIRAAARGGFAKNFIGDYHSAEDLQRIYDAVPFDPKQTGDSLTVMRASMAQQEDARFLLGGSLGGSGNFPGVLEEAKASITAGKLVLPLAAYGGAAHDAAVALGLLDLPLLQRSGQSKALHPNYPEIIRDLQQLQSSYRHILHEHAVPWELARDLAVADGAERIAELAREALRLAFGPQRSGL
jgi:hypothetical protein